DPVDPVVAGECLAGGVCIGRLGIIYEGDPGDFGDLLLPMRKTRKGAETGGDHRRFDTGRLAGGIGGSGILPIVFAWQARQLAKGQYRRLLAGGLVPEHAILGINSSWRPPAAGNGPDHLIVLLEQLLPDAAADVVVNPDDGGSRLRLPVKDISLDRHVALEAAMALQMIRRDVKQDPDVESDRKRELQLVARELEHVEAIGLHWLEFHDRAADVAAHINPAPRQEIGRAACRERERD